LSSVEDNTIVKRTNGHDVEQAPTSLHGLAADADLKPLPELVVSWHRSNLLHRTSSNPSVLLCFPWHLPEQRCGVAPRVHATLRNIQAGPCTRKPLTLKQHTYCRLRRVIEQIDARHKAQRILVLAHCRAGQRLRLNERSNIAFFRLSSGLNNFAKPETWNLEPYPLAHSLGCLGSPGLSPARLTCPTIAVTMQYKKVFTLSPKKGVNAMSTSAVPARRANELIPEPMVQDTALILKEGKYRLAVSALTTYNCVHTQSAWRSGRAMPWGCGGVYASF